MRKLFDIQSKIKLKYMENKTSPVPVLKVENGINFPDVSRWMLVFFLIGLVLHLLWASTLFLGTIFVAIGILDPIVGVYLNKIPFNQISAGIILIFFVVPLIVSFVKWFNRL
jgi:hypothetical protein